MSGWSEISRDLLAEIWKHVKSYHDFLSFGSVCKSWKSATMEDFRYKDRQTPWLMLGSEGEETCSINLRSFYSISKGMCRPRQLGKAKWISCFSSQGWLITVGLDLFMSLLHPFSGAEIQLPHISTSKDNWDKFEAFEDANYFNKCVISSSDSILMVSMNNKRGRLAYYRAGDKAWSSIEERFIFNYKYHDIAYYKGQFYLITSGGKIIACDLKSNTAHHLAELPPPRQDFETLYLVESAGELLVVSRQVKIFEWSRRTCGFKVFKVDLLNTKMWTDMKSIGNRAIFLGPRSSSFSTEASPCIKPNCIYFTESAYTLSLPWDPVKDVGIYNLQDGSIESFTELNSFSYFDPCHCLPMWVEQR